MNRVLRVILLVILASGLLITGCSPNSTPTQETKGSDLAPDFILPDLEGRPVSLSDFGGKPVLINFWASRCGPCLYEMPYLQQVYEEWSAKGLVLLAINKGESSSRVTEFVNAYGLSLPVLLDTKQVVAQKYRALGIPISFFIDKDGIIQAVKIGPFSSVAEIEEYLSQVMS